MDAGPTDAGTIADAGSATAADAGSATAADAGSATAADAARPLLVGRRSLHAGKGDPAAWGCTLRDDGHLDCSDPATGKSRVLAVPTSVAQALISKAEERERTCVVPPAKERAIPGSIPVGSLSDQERSVPLCDPGAALTELRALESAYKGK
ncbi:hypothetical protein AKJ09_02328 [Labilithrix luteola]|uniref:Uncharacterized protein n=1 Tax=Labilithrix luteola TaxID=1391654 RepID=A0A0K1PRC4_9BACT|nr:hypothetical protein AKJ09_02328 [Labilithrix luteola]